MRRLIPALVAAALLALAPAADSRPAVALNNANQLLYVDTADPGAVFFGVYLQGLQPGETMLAVDYRPANGKLYGLGSTSRLYTINEKTGRVAQVGDPFPVPLGGTSFGFDFHPVPDRIRVVSDVGQNWRLNPDTGGQLIDSSLSSNNVGAVAYTNNFPGTVLTTLYGIDFQADTLVRIGGVNGTPSANLGAVTTIGPLGVAAPANVGLDITSPGGVAYATIGGSLYTINPSTGAATLVGQISSSLLTITDIAVPPMDPTILAVNTNNELFSLKPSAPGTPTGATPITAPGSEQVTALDYRPETGELYGLGASSHVLKINRSTGVATQIGPAFTPTLNGAYFGFDFAGDLIKLTSEGDQHQRLDPDTGLVIDGNPVMAGTQGDSPVTPAGADLTALAGEPTPGFTLGNPLAIDTANDQLVRLFSNGTFSTVGGALGIDFGPMSGFDMLEPDLGLASSLVGTDNNLYVVDLKGGQARPIGTIQAGAPNVRGITLVPRGHFEHAALTASAAEADGQVTLTVNRTRATDGRVTIEYDTQDDTAKAGEDYTASGGLLDFAPGETSKTLSVPLIDDGGIEDPETFKVRLTDPTNGATVSSSLDSIAAVTITSEDAPTTAPPPAGDTPPADQPPAPTPTPAAAREPDSAIGRIARALAARKLKAIRGTASDPDGDLARVEVAVVRLTGGARAARAGCQALTRAGRLKPFKLVRKRCRPATFLRATGLARWSLKLKRRLPRGSYVVYSRAVDKGGHREKSFTAADGNRRVFRVR